MTGSPGRLILGLVTDIDLVPDQEELVDRIMAAVHGGVDLVQVRARSLSAEDLNKFASRVVNEVGRAARVVVNGDPEIAKSSGADGVHLPENGVAISKARSILGLNAMIGKSVHSTEAAVRAEKEGADYIFFGTVFPSRSHPGGTNSGVSGVAEVSLAVSIPVIGIGGITSRNSKSVINSGAAGVAVIGAIIGERDSYRAARAIRISMAG